MLLCLDVGNSHILGGVFNSETLACTFRRSTHPAATADELGVFLAAVLRARGVAPEAITEVAICCVVPAALHALQRACIEYHRLEPLVLQAGVKTGLKVLYRNPHEVGADRIANAIGGTLLHPGRNLIIVDCGTATTLDVVTAAGEYLGGAILPGVGISAAALAGHTAKLPHVQIVRPDTALGRTTHESINAGLYHGQVGAINRLIEGITAEHFGQVRPLVIGTGGFAGMFEPERLFDVIVPELVLLGLKQAVKLNR